MDTEEKKRRGPKPTGKTPLRSIRVPTDEWDEWRAATDGNEEGVSGLIRQAVRAELARRRRRAAKVI